MKILVALILSALCLPVVAEENERAATLVRTLSSGSAVEARAASEELQKLGAPALAELRKAAASDDAQASSRAKDVLDAFWQAPGLVPPHLHGQLVAAHPGEQAIELLRAVELILPGRGPEKEARHDGLTDVGLVEEPPQTRVAQQQTYLAAQQGLAALPQRFGRGGVTGADTADQAGKGIGLGHGRAAPAGRDG